ncbi:MAG: hypothetical protein JWN74_106 [Acidobacteriaceae bacterium]|nr:hypothetical protein [Acidobacteriaceae bacterium]
MNRIIRKSSCSMHVGYSSGNFSNNMRGRNFAFGVVGGQACLTVDMSGNLRVQNKAGYEYLDARDFVQQHNKVQHIQIPDDVVKKFARNAQSNRIVKSAAPTDWLLELYFADESDFLYRVLNLAVDTVIFDVRFQGKFQRPSAREMEEFNSLF